MKAEATNRLVAFGSFLLLLTISILRADEQPAEDDAIPEDIRDYSTKQQALAHVLEVKTEEFKEDELVKLYPDAGIRSFHIVSVFSPKHAELSGMPHDAKRLYVHEGGKRVYTAFDRKDMLALARLAPLRLDTRERLECFARQVSGPILAVREQKKGSWLIHWGYSGRVGGGTALLTVDERMIPVGVRSFPE